MPGTFSHPAAVLPLRRLTPRRLNFAALVIGSMTPDFGYFINRFDLSSFAHTFAGTFLACVPTGVLLLLLLYLFARPVCYTLPSPHRQALLPICPAFPRRVSAWLIILLSLLLGAWTHTLWDAFTHENGLFVEQFAVLREPAFRTGSSTTHVYLALQEVSTILGFVILVIAYGIWLRRHGKPLIAWLASDLWRYLFWLTIAVISFAFALPAAWRFANSTSLHDFLYGRSVIFHFVLNAADIGVPLALIVSAIIYARRPRPAPQMHEETAESVQL